MNPVRGVCYSQKKKTRLCMGMARSGEPSPTQRVLVATSRQGHAAGAVAYGKP